MISLTRSAARYVSKLSNRLRRKLDALSSKQEFSGAQGRILHFLLAQTEDVFQRDIEEEYGIRPSTASQLLKQMEENGLILRQSVSYDNRLKQIQLTEKALTCQRQVVEDLTRLEEDLTQGIPEEELEVFFRVIQQMMDNLSQ